MNVLRVNEMNVLSEFKKNLSNEPDFIFNNGVGMNVHYNLRFNVHVELFQWR